jgi:DNA polymerase/3'-5' exonuclease PolX
VTFPARIAQAAADQLVRDLAGACELDVHRQPLLTIAGSLRRGAAEVKDIEVVISPGHRPDLFGGEGFDLLNEALLFLTRSHRIQWRGRKGGLSSTPPELDGRRYYAFAVLAPTPIPVDLFAVRPPAQWGPLLAIRTGPADYSRRLVTSALGRGLRCQDGRLIRVNAKGEPQLGPDGQPIALDTPTEREFIERCGMRYLDPAQRH